MHRLIRDLRRKGWTVSTRSEDGFRLPEHVEQRYGAVPSDMSALLSGIEECIAPDKRSWFLCEPDFFGRSDSAFRWNGFEMLSLDAAKGDLEWEAQIKDFWDVHLPIYLSVQGVYAFVAVRIRGQHAGSLFEGIEPEFEEVTKVADGVFEFVSTLCP